MRAAAALALFCAGCATADPVPLAGLEPNLPGETIRMSELRDLPERDVVRRVLGPLELFPYLGHRSSRDFHEILGLARLSFWSTARGAGHAGICRSQQLKVAFTRAFVPSMERDDPTMRSAGFDLDDYYFIENETEAFGPYSEKQRPAHELETACRKLDPRRRMATKAPSAFHLIRAGTLVESLGAAARSGKAPAPLDCARFHWNGEAPSEAECLRALSLLHRESVRLVRECSTRRAAPGGCVMVLTPDHFIEFDLSGGGQPIRIVIEAPEDMSQAHIVF